jgi:hypothetical protein
LGISKIFVKGFGSNGYCILSVLDFEFVGFDCVRFEFEKDIQIQIYLLNPNTPTGPQAHHPSKPEPNSLFPFLSSPACEPAHVTGPAQHRAPSRRPPPVHPGQLTGGSRLSAFPFLASAATPARSAPRRRPLPRRDRNRNRPRSLFSFLPRPRPRSPCVTWQPRLPVPAPRQPPRPPARAPPFPRLGRPRCRAPEPLDGRRVAVARTPGITALGARARATNPRPPHKKPSAATPKTLAARALPSSTAAVARGEERRAEGGGEVLREEEPVDDYTAAARSCARRKTPSHAGASPSRRPRSSTSTLQRTPHGTDPPASPHRSPKFPLPRPLR